MLQYIIQTKLCPASQYFSTTLTNLPNWNPDAHKCFVFNSLLTIITIANLCLFLASCWFLRQFLLISQHGSVFNYIPMDDSTSHYNNSIFPSPKYLSSDILYILRHCQYSSTSTPTIAISTVFVAWISTFENQGINNPALAFFIRNVDTAPNDVYLIWEKCVLDLFPFFYSALFNTNIRLASDIYWLDTLHEKKIFLPWYSALVVVFVDYYKLDLQFLYLIWVQGCLKICAGFEAAINSKLCFPKFDFVLELVCEKVGLSLPWLYD